MTTETTTPVASDDFDGAFAQFAVPEADVKVEPTAAPAAPAAGETPPAAEGGNKDGPDTGAASAGAGGAEPTGAGSPAGAEPAAKPGEVAPANATDKGAAPAAAPAASDAGAGVTPPAAVTPPAGEAPKPADAEAILDKLGKLVEAAQTPKPAEAPAAATDTPASPYTPEQQAELAQYEKDWPDVAKMEGIRRQGEYKQLLDFVFQEVRKYVDPRLETLDSLAGRTHLSDVKANIPDYSDQLRQSVIDWTKTQPAYLQPAFEHVIHSGTAEEVKDLVDRYRQATGQAVSAPGGAVVTPPNQAPGRTNELSGAAKEAAAALAPVESKRSEVVQSGDPSNFDDAWKQFAKDLG